jgi:hypothetical protein
MLAFDHNILFLDEPTLIEIPQKELETIVVKKVPYMSLKEVFKLRSPWVEMTKRRVRYYSNQPFSSHDTPQVWGLEIEGVMTLVWYSHQKTIYYIPKKHYSVEYLVFWVLHTFLPLLFFFENRYHILHASGVQVGEKAILFSAFSGGGKSTLTEYFIHQGHSIFGDDTIALSTLDKGYNVVASYPFYRPFRVPECLGYHIKNFVSIPKRLHCLYRLKRASATASIEICPLEGIEKFRAIYQSMFITFEYFKKERYALAIDMAKTMQVFQIIIPWDKNRLDEVYDTIVAHNLMH